NEHRSSSRRGCTEDLTDIATIAYILATRPDTDNVIGCGNIGASTNAQGRVLVAGGVEIERLKTDGRVAAVDVSKERLITVGRVAVAGEVAKKGERSIGRVLGADRVA